MPIPLRLTLLNDIHIEPDYTAKFEAYKLSHVKDMKLVPFHKNADNETQAVLAAVIDQAVNLYDIFTSRVEAFGNDSTEDLIRKWAQFENQ